MKKKISKVDREDMSNGNTLLHYAIIFSFTRSLSYEHSEKINETALGSKSKNVVSEIEIICKLP